MTTSLQAYIIGAGIHATIREDWDNDSPEWAQSKRHFKFQLRYNGKSMSGWWYQGIEAQAPKVQVILECLVSDFASNELSFEDFVYEFGYEIKDVASYREVEKTYKQVMRQNKSLLRVFGADLLRSMSEAI